MQEHALTTDVWYLDGLHDVAEGGADGGDDSLITPPALQHCWALLSQLGSADRPIVKSRHLGSATNLQGLPMVNVCRCKAGKM